MTIRVDKILANLGYCSRSTAVSFLKQHTVCVKEERIIRPADKINAADLRIDGNVPDHVNGIFIVLHKPSGYICTHDSSEGKRVYDLLPQQWMLRNPVPSTVGRLDKDTTGVLLITDNSAINHSYTSSRHGIEKVYQVAVDKPLPHDLIRQFASGELLLDGEPKPCLPAVLRITDEKRAEVVLTEGKYHQVKRMFGMFGFTVVSLHRSRFGTFTVDSLPEGAYEEVTPAV